MRTYIKYIRNLFLSLYVCSIRRVFFHVTIELVHLLIVTVLTTIKTAPLNRNHLNLICDLDFLSKSLISNRVTKASYSVVDVFLI